MFHTKQEAIDAGVLNAEQINIGDPANFNKLQGMYAAPDLHAMLGIIDNAGAYDTGVGGFLGAINTLSGATKLSLAVHDPSVGAASVISGVGLIAQNFPLLSQDFGVVIDAYQQTINEIAGKENAIDLRTELGIGGGSARLQDITAQTAISGNVIQRTLALVEGALPNFVAPTEGALRNPLTRASNGFTTLMLGLHKLGDEVPQRVIFNARLNLAKNHYGMSDEAANTYATDYVRNTGFYAPSNPPVIKGLQKLPFLGGGFTGWYSSMLISAKNQASALLNEFILSADRHGRLNNPNYDGSNPEMVRAARASFLASPDLVKGPVGAGVFGLAGAVFMPSAVALGVGSIVGGLGQLIGSDDDELKLHDPEMEDMIGRLSPDYYENIDRQITNISSDGKSLEYINVSRLGSYGIFTEVKNALFNSDPADSPDTIVAKALTPLIEPYLSPTFGLQHVSEAITGRDDFGNQIYEDDDNFVEKTVKSAGHIAANTFGNGFFREIVPAISSVVADEEFNKFNGTDVSIGDFAQRLGGFKPVKFDVIKGLQQKTWEEGRLLRSSKKKFSSSVFSFGELSQGQAENTINKVRKANDDYFKSIITKVEAARYFGISDIEIARTLSSAGVSGFKSKAKTEEGMITGNVKLILAGQIPAYKFPEGSAKNFRKKFADRSISPEARARVESNIRLVQRLVDGG